MLSSYMVSNMIFNFYFVSLNKKQLIQTKRKTTMFQKEILPIFKKIDSPNFAHRSLISLSILST